VTAETALAGAMLAAAALVAVVSTGPRRHVACAAVLGIIAMRLFVWGAPDGWRYLASCAVWVAVGSAAIRRNLNLSGVCFIASGLCYAAQEVARLPPVIGNPFLVAADLFWWLALVGVYRGRLAGVSAEMGGLGRGHPRRTVLACSCAPDQTPPKI
jgi:hypothetical protein